MCIQRISVSAELKACFLQDTEDTEDFEPDTYAIVDDETDTEEGIGNSGDPLLDIEDYTENIGDGSAPVSADGEGA